MSEYIPTTDEVRSAYRLWFGGSTWVAGKADELDAQFDDWLVEVKAEAWREGALWAAVECRAIETEDEPWLAPSDNPYCEEKE